MPYSSSPDGGAGQLKMLRRVPCDQDSASLASYRSDSCVTGAHQPLAIYRPRDAKDVAKVVTWAAKENVGVIPVSSAPPRRRGDTVPANERCVVLDLSGLNRIVHADGRDKIIVVEPGVRFGDVDQRLASHGLRAFRPLKPRAGKSLIASYLEREPLISPNHYWDTSDPFGGTAIVLGNGTLTLTGGAATPGTLEQKLARGDRQMVPAGPTNLDLVRVLQGAQGSLGTMTWAAVYCEAVPAIEQAWFATSDALDRLTTLARELMVRGLGNALFIVDRVHFALMVADGDAEFQTLSNTLPRWILFTRISAGRRGAAQQYAPKDKLAWQQRDLEACARACSAKLEATLGGKAADAFGRWLHRSEPTSYRDRLRGDHRELFFLQQLNRAEDFVGIAASYITGRRLGRLPLGVYIQPTLQGVSAHIEFTVPVDPQQAELAARLDEAMLGAAKACSEAGAFFSRPYHAWSDLAFAKDQSIAPLLAMTKSVLDPAGVMNPGRIPYGVS